MNKHLHNSLRALFLSLTVLMSLPMMAVEIDGINYDFNAEAKEATVIAKSGGNYSGEVVIPESLEHEGTAYSVTSIGGSAFYCCSGLTSVTIGNSVESIGECAFYGCYGLTSVTIPNSVTSIRDYAFCDCGLTTVTIPNSVTSIGDGVFSHCSALTSVTIGNSVTSIGESAFRACSGLTSLTIPNSVTSIGGYAFYGCTSLFNITIPSGISKIENHTFVDCISLTRITIPDNITEIGEYAFRGCRKINKLLIGSSVNSILTNAFEYCSGLTLLVLPKSLRWVSSNVFHGCTNLKTVINFSSETPKRGEIDCGYAGYYAERVANISDGNMYLDGDFVFNRINSGNELLAYLGSDSDITLPDWSNNGDESYSISGGIFKNDKTVISITVPKSVIGIGSEAFYGCSGLTSVTIPNSVTSIGGYAFADCSELLDVYCYAEKAPSTNSYAFSSSPIADATLHVPNASINSYKATAPWSGFGKIVALTDEEHIVDGTLEEYVNESERSPIDIHYTRTLPNMLWNPLYVPFKIPYEDLQENYEVAYINAMHSYDNDDNGEIDDMVMEIVKIKAGTLKPNHPYLIKAKNEEAKVMSIVQENATLYPAEITTLDCSSVYTKFEITGTYQKMTSDDLNGSLIISTDGAWKKLSPTSTLKPFRFYLTISSREGSPVEIAEDAMSRVRIRVMGEDDNATGIDEVKTANDEQKSEIYDLSGRRVSAPAKGGVYIIKGKKVIY